MRIILNTLAILCICALCFACSKVNQERFDEVKQGMSMSEVVAILGQPTNSESISIAGISGTSSTWKSQDAQIDIQFLNDKVAIKTFSKPKVTESSVANPLNP